MSPPQAFFKKYLVTIVMVPSIIGIHLGWNFLQQKPALVKEEERIELPLLTIAKHMWNRVQGSSDSKNQKEN